VIAVDTNLLVYAHREEMQWHEAAREAIAGLASGAAAWAVPWPCVHEFFSIVTHPRIFDPPTPRGVALDAIAGWMESDSLVLLAEATGYFDVLWPLVDDGRVVGPRVHDARIAALCLQHGVHELWSADRDFSRFPALRIRNPLVG